MKSPGAVYRKLKEVKFRHLIALYKIYLKKTPDNCKYSYMYWIEGPDKIVHPIRLCLLHQNSLDLKSGIIPHLIDVCQCIQQAEECNGFLPKYTREDVKLIFEKELETKKVRETKYPDICALEWVLERSSVGIPPRNKWQIFMDGIKKIFGIKKKDGEL